MSRKRGFTLVELLVVIAIIGILVGLLLPAVQAAREAARRMQCSNNLKNIALACHNYHDTYKSLPTGYIAPNGSGRSNAPAWSWSALVLPFMEQQPLYDLIDPTSNSLTNAVALHGMDAGDPMATPVDTFRCPSSVAPDLNNVAQYLIGSNDGLAVSNYPGVTSTRELIPGNGENGCFVYDRGVKFRDILDGTSNTLMIGERSWQYTVSRSHPTASLAGSWSVGGAAMLFGTPRSQGGRRFLAPAVGWGLTRLNFQGYFSTGGALDERRRSGFSSQHPGGAMFAIGDASVGLIPETIELKMISESDPSAAQFQVSASRAADNVYQRLLSRDDGNSVTLP